MELAMKRKGSRQTLIIWEGREGGRESLNVKNGGVSTTQ
jgi:hypothetical protein